MKLAGYMLGLAMVLVLTGCGTSRKATSAPVGETDKRLMVEHTDDEVILSWVGEVDTAYRVLYTDDLVKGPWHELPGLERVAGEGERVYVKDEQPDQRRYYRLEIIAVDQPE